MIYPNVLIPVCAKTEALTTVPINYSHYTLLVCTEFASPFIQKGEDRGVYIKKLNALSWSFINWTLQYITLVLVNLTVDLKFVDLSRRSAAWLIWCYSVTLHLLKRWSVFRSLVKCHACQRKTMARLIKLWLYLGWMTKFGDCKIIHEPA